MLISFSEPHWAWNCKYSFINNYQKNLELKIKTSLSILIFRTSGADSNFDEFVKNKCHTPNPGVWPTRGKYTLMPPKPWPTSYLLNFRHDLARLERLPTCKSHKSAHSDTPQNKYMNNIYHQLYIYTYHIKMYTTLSVVNRVSMWRMIQQN